MNEQKASTVEDTTCSGCCTLSSEALRASFSSAATRTVRAAARPALSPKCE
jgi:hypothetical protein